MSLEELRQDIDRLDRRIVSLLDERAEVARRAAAEKMALGLPLRDSRREEEILRRLSSLSNGSMPASGLANIYRQVMAETLALEGCVGESGSTGRPGGKLDIVAEVIENMETSPGYRRMRLRAPELAGVFSPGQFFQLRIASEAGGPFLRRPFAPSETLPDGFAFVYAVVGVGTRLMARLPSASRVGIVAPLGRGYTLLERGGEAILVGGGCGGPSLGPLAESLSRAGVGVTVVLGARSACHLLGRTYLEQHARKVIVATDDGSEGVEGTVVTALERRLDSSPAGRIYACGPLPMLRAVAGIAASRGVACEVSLEERMACGFGACVGCVVETVAPDGTTVYRRVCHDGPVFDAAIIRWG